jgi:ferrochelatase
MTRYQNQADYLHDSPECMGVLLTNLGTPDSPAPADVRRYLAEFLSDPRVIEMPRALWWPVLHGVILRTRPRRSARLYAKVWSSDGAPLLRISILQAQALQSSLGEAIGGPVKVVLAMRYGTPSIRQGLESLRQANARRVVVLPLYPQYSATSTGSVFDEVTAVLQCYRWLPELRVINHYHDHPAYIEALAASIRNAWETQTPPDRLVFSFHGIPREYFLAGDPYHCECHKTARLVAQILDLSPERWLVSFQSRLGPKQWLKPYTDHTLKALGKEGVSRVHVICPGFAADCLETLEEIAMQNREIFLQAGGAEYHYIPALNDDVNHIAALTDIVLRHTQGWPETGNDWDPAATNHELALRRQRAEAMKGSG